MRNFMAPIIRISTIRLFREILSASGYVEFQKSYNDIRSWVNGSKLFEKLSYFFSRWQNDKFYILYIVIDMFLVTFEKIGLCKKYI